MLTSHSFFRRLFAACLAGLLLSVPLRGQSSSGTGSVDFTRDIRPILAAHCYACHGPDETSRSADLRLDLRDDAIAHSAIVPNDPGLSKLVERILS
ncbi:MAG: c-type cytochrome domain-containing protein, partial [Pirellula sp.]